MRSFKHLLVGSALAALCASAALADEPVKPPEAPSSGILSYPQLYFAGAQLTTALDMVQRLPGFLFDDGSNVRGFAGAAGNVLINGRRPTAKTDDLESILQRIPAGKVLEIDVIRGGAPGIDMQGQSVVANVITSSDDSQTVIATLQNIWFSDNHNMPGGSVQFTDHDGGTVYDVTLTRYVGLADDSSGNGYYVYSEPGGLTESAAARRRDADYPGWGVNGSVATPLWGGTFGTNLTYKTRQYNSRTTYDAPLSDYYFTNSKGEPFEMGANWDGKLGNTELTVLGLQRLEHDYELDTATAPGDDELFIQRRDTGESILRSTVRYAWTPDLTLETGGEGAYNTLNGTADYIDNGTPVVLPASDARVNERRGEVFAQGTWRFMPGWSLEAGTRTEFSRISALGIPSRSLSYVKPRVLLTMAPDGWGQFRIRAERVVGQLDFSNFVASSNLSGNGVNAGNLNLKPDARWQYEADWEYHFWDKGALVLSAMHEDISDLVDYVPIGDGLDGPGNIAKARNDEFKVNLSVPTDRMGLAGGIFKANLKWDDGAVRDPVTGRTRAISDQKDRDLNFEYLQDFAAWNSTLDVSFTPGAWSRPDYRINQIQEVRLKTPYIQAAWTYTPEKSLELSFEVDDFIPYHLEIEQYNYDNTRLEPLTSILDVRNNTQPRVFIQARKTFD